MVRSLRLLAPCCIAIWLALPVFTPTHGASITRLDSPSHSRQGWRQHDRAVYVVSTLNAPVCSSGQQLSTVLWTHDGARFFDVLEGTKDPGIYFIQVRNNSHSLLSVYSYRFGWKLPAGLLHSKCVPPSPNPSIGVTYRAKQWRLLAHFNTTFPQS